MALKQLDGKEDWGSKFTNLYNRLTDTVNNLSAGTPAGTYSAGDGIDIDGSSEITTTFASNAQTITGTSSVLVTHPAGVAAAIADVMDAGSQHRSCHYRNTDQAITANTETKISWNAEAWDIGNDFAGADYTAPSTGYYDVVVQVLISGNVASDLVTLTLKVNSASIGLDQREATGTSWETYAITRTVYATSGQLINAHIKNDTTAVSVKAQVDRSYMQVTKVGE